MLILYACKINICTYSQMFKQRSEKLGIGQKKEQIRTPFTKQTLNTFISGNMLALGKIPVAGQDRLFPRSKVKVIDLSDLALKNQLTSISKKGKICQLPKVYSINLHEHIYSIPGLPTLP